MVKKLKRIYDVQVEILSGSPMTPKTVFDGEMAAVDILTVMKEIQRLIRYEIVNPQNVYAVNITEIER